MDIDEQDLDPEVERLARIAQIAAGPSEEVLPYTPSWEEIYPWARDRYRRIAAAVQAEVRGERKPTPASVAELLATASTSLVQIEARIRVLYQDAAVHAHATFDQYMVWADALAAVRDTILRASVTAG